MRVPKFIAGIISACQKLDDVTMAVPNSSDRNLGKYLAHESDILFAGFEFEKPCYATIRTLTIGYSVNLDIYILIFFPTVLYEFGIM